MSHGLLERSGSRLSRVRPGSTVSSAPAASSGVICCNAAMSGSPMATLIRAQLPLESPTALDFLAGLLRDPVLLCYASWCQMQRALRGK
jgi:hypothetical protein